MINFISGPFLIWFPKIIYFVFAIFSVGFYFFRSKLKISGEKVFWRLSFALIIFKILENSLKTVLQYYFWSLDQFTKIWTENWYWFDYSFRRFWLNLFVSLFVGLLFFVFLKLLKRHKNRFFEDGEVELGFFSALLLGWPNFLIFVPMVFLSVVIVSIIRQIFYKKLYTTLGYPFLLGTLLTMFFGDWLLSLFNLGFLKI